MCIKYLYYQNFIRKYGNECYLPFKIYLLTGYKEGEFGLYFVWDHVYFDGTNINF